MATAPRKASRRGKAASKPVPRRKPAPRRPARARAASAGNPSFSVSQNAEATIADIERLRDDVVKLGRSLSELMASRAETAKDNVADTASGLYDTGLQYVRGAEGQVRGVAGDAVRRVQENPLAALGIVFGVGYIIGLMRRR